MKFKSHESIQRYSKYVLRYVNTQLKRFNHQIDKIKIDFFLFNAGYNSEDNSIILGIPYLLKITKKELKATLAHEMAHAIDPGLRNSSRHSQEYFADYMVPFLGGTYQDQSSVLQKAAQVCLGINNGAILFSYSENHYTHPSILKRLKNMGLISLLDDPKAGNSQTQVSLLNRLWGWL